MTGRRLLLAAVEPSADALGASLIRSLKKKMPGVTLTGCGGPLMAAEGFESRFDTSAFSVMGFTDVARVLPEAWRRSREIAAICEKEQIDTAIFVDGWSFSRLAAKRIRKRAPATRIVKFGAPQVWASRPQRVDFVRDHFDLVLTLLPFEPSYFEEVGTKAVFVGNPNFETVAQTPRSGPSFRSRHDIGSAPLLAVLPGSRKGEVNRLLVPFADAVSGAAEKIPGLRVVIPAAPAVADLVRENADQWPVTPLIIPAEERFDAFEAADVALAASGTVTTELALCDTPMVVGYRVDPLTAYWAKKVLVTEYVSILNVFAQEAIIPERLQEECTPEQLTADIVRLFRDDEARRHQLSAFRRLLPDLVGDGHAADRAAEEIASLADTEDSVDLDSSAEGQ
ncbi:MAG: lipid-A-disaccharide synthase [Pseudomonadota bacterium]